MKKLFLLFLFIPILAFAGSIQQRQIGILEMYSVGGGCSCGSSPNLEIATGTADMTTGRIKYNAGLHRPGTTYNSSTERQVCRIDAMLTKSNGDISGITYNIKIYSKSGTSLGSLLATSDGVTGSNAWADTWVQFDFSTPYTLSTSTDYAILVDTNSAVSSVNYAWLQGTTGGSVWADGQFTNWADDDTQNATYPDEDNSMRLFVCE